MAAVVRRLALANESLAIHAEDAKVAAQVDKLELELEPLDEAWKRG